MLDIYLTVISIGLKKFNLIDRVDVGNVERIKKNYEQAVTTQRSHHHRQHLYQPQYTLHYILRKRETLCVCVCVYVYRKHKKHVVHNLRSRKFRADIAVC